MNFLRLTLYFFCILAFSIPDLLAQKFDSIVGLNEVTVTGVLLNNFNTGHFYTVIDSSTMATQASSYLGDILTSSSLFQINNYGAGSVSVSARGMGEKRTPVVWNGFNIQSILSSGTDLAELPSFYFEDVEAQMGGSSALFGSGAAGGILFLNNNQRFNQGIKGQIISHIGSFGTYYGGGELSFSNGIYSGSVKGYYNKATNNFAYKANYSGIEIDTTQLNAQAKQYGFMMNNLFRFSSTQELNLNLWYSNNDKNVAPTLSEIAYNAVADGDQKDKFFAATTEYNSKFKNINLYARSGLFRTKLNYEKPSYFEISSSKALWWVNEIEVATNVAKFMKINGGVNFTYEQVKSSTFEEKKTRYREALFASVKYSNPDMHLSVSANGRGEIAAGDTMPFTWSVGAEYNPVQFMAVKANIAKNYRLPSFNDLYYKDSYSVGNPDLKSEKGMNYELGLEFLQTADFYKITIGSNFFLSRMDNWMNWAERSDGIWTVYNIDKADISGLETYFETGFKNEQSELTGKVMYSYTEAKDRNTKNYISNVPQNKITYNLKARVYNTSVNFQMTDVGERYSNSSNSNKIAAYSISNIIVTQTIKYLNSSFSVDLGVYNLFDKDYMVMNGYPMPKRNFRAGLRILF
jgi:outer membrane cobalamin receptor